MQGARPTREIPPLGQQVGRILERKELEQGPVCVNWPEARTCPALHMAGRGIGGNGPKAV